MCHVHAHVARGMWHVARGMCMCCACVSVCAYDRPRARPPWRRRAAHDGLPAGHEPRALVYLPVQRAVQAAALAPRPPPQCRLRHCGIVALRH
eukprot:239771-Prymnesium_polylepis.2